MAGIARTHKNNIYKHCVKVIIVNFFFVIKNQSNAASFPICGVACYLLSFIQQ